MHLEEKSLSDLTLRLMRTIRTKRPQPNIRKIQGMVVMVCMHVYVCVFSVSRIPGNFPLWGDGVPSSNRYPVIYS